MTKAVGILVFTNQAVLEHKKKNGKISEDSYCYLEPSRFPKRFFENEDADAELRLYFAVKGQVKGYFIIDDLDDVYLYFDSESWKPIENGEILKPSQGWRYYLHDA